MKDYLAAVLTKPRTFRLEKRKLRRLKPSEVLIRVAYAGICGTDLALYSGDYVVPLPLVPGHEFSGAVELAGSSKFSHLVGKRVTAEINNTCLSYGYKRPCAACRNGFDYHCLRRTTTGIIRHDGAFSEYIVVPGRNVHVLPRSISLEEAVFIEPLAAALQTFRLSPLSKDKLVIVLGAGRLGLLIGIVAKSKGAKVMMVTRSEEKREIARNFGLDARFISESKEIIKKTRKWTENLGADMVVEATGSADMISVALQIVRPRGIIALKSTPGVPARQFDITKVVVDEIQLQGSRCGDFGEAIKFLKVMKTPVAGLIESIFPLREIKKAHKCARTKPKILLHCVP